MDTSEGSGDMELLRKVVLREGEYFSVGFFGISLDMVRCLSAGAPMGPRLRRRFVKRVKDVATTTLHQLLKEDREQWRVFDNEAPTGFRRRQEPTRLGSRAGCGR